jgi:ectoine hydroxylase-related dioxygenase (phytanoyl-CoA dioxygenase family)
MLTTQQIEFYETNGYLRIPQMFTPAETDELSEHLNWLIDDWAVKDMGWTGPWRKKYMDAATEKKSQLIALHDLYYYSDAWSRAVTKKKLCGAMADLIGPVVELHHSTLHVKPPESGHPFPMHQDWAFYKHANERYVDVLVHLDDTRHENGEIRFLAGSHKQGALEHVTIDPETGQGCTPHLPTDRYRLEDTVPVPARRGDVVCFNIHTIHGSYINTTDRNRRLVRLGYRAPDNRQTEGQSIGRPGWIVWGRRPKREGDVPMRGN